MKIKSTEQLPAYKTSRAAGFDIITTGETKLMPGRKYKLATSMSVELPKPNWAMKLAGLLIGHDLEYEMQVRPRSGMTLREGVEVTLGTIDADYRGEIGIIIENTGRNPYVITPGMRVAQGVIAIVVKPKMRRAYELSDTERGAGGFGSTGK